MKTKEYAESIGKSRQAIERQIKRGAIKSYKKNGVTHVNVKSADAFYQNKIVNKSGKAGEIDTFVDDETEKHPQELSTLSKVEIALRAERYKTQKLKNEQSEKRLISVDKLNDRLFDFIRKLRDHQQNLPDALSDKLLGCNTRHEIEQILRDYETKGMKLISEDFNETDFDSPEALKKKTLPRLIQ